MLPWGIWLLKSPTSGMIYRDRKTHKRKKFMVCWAIFRDRRTRKEVRTWLRQLLDLFAGAPFCEWKSLDSIPPMGRKDKPSSSSKKIRYESETESGSNESESQDLSPARSSGKRKEWGSRSKSSRRSESRKRHRRIRVLVMIQTIRKAARIATAVARRSPRDTMVGLSFWRWTRLPIMSLGLKLWD